MYTWQYISEVCTVKTRVAVIIELHHVILNFLFVNANMVPVMFTLVFEHLEGSIIKHTGTFGHGTGQCPQVDTRTIQDLV